MRVLVTDAGFKNSLSVIRNLGRHGLDVVAAAPSRLSQGFFSRFCSARLICPEPDDHQRFLEWVLRTIDDYHHFASEDPHRTVRTCPGGGLGVDAYCVF